MLTTTSEGREYTLGRGLPAQRVYRMVSARTLAQDVWMTKAVRKAGLDSVSIPKGMKAETEEYHDFLTALVSKVFEVNVIGDLIAGCLIPVADRAWNLEHAKEAAIFVLDLVDEEEKREMLALVTELLQSFLLSGRNS